MYGKIYRLDQGDLTFIGSTRRLRLGQRLCNHRRNFNQWVKTGLGYNASFELFKNGNPTITLIESFHCASRAELRSRQGYHQLQIKNINLAGNPEGRHIEHNTEERNGSNAYKIKQYNATYYERNSIRLKFKNIRNYYNTKRIILLNEFITNHLSRQTLI